MNKTKIAIVAILVTAIGCYFIFDVGQYLTLEYVQSQLGAIQNYKDQNFVYATVIYLVIYVAVAALSIPGAAILTLIGGAIFGLGWGLLIVSFASSIGATLAFLVSRTLLRDWVQSRYGGYLAPINKGIEKDGVFYLFSIRMVPLFPFFIVNLLMGLTPIKTVYFYTVSQIGMLLGTAVYINAGSELAQITSLSGLLSGSLVFSFALLGLSPLIARFIVNYMQRNKIMKKFVKPKKFDVNVVVIGAGSAGLVASTIVAGAKAKVILVEKHKMGGDCLNTGCVPSKSLIRSGRIMSYIKRSEEYGIDNGTGDVDFSKVMKRIQAVIKTIEPHDSIERFTALGVECVSGEAFIESPYTVKVGDRVINTRSIIVSTGARPLVPPIQGLDQIEYLTSDSVWELRELPKHLLVVGGGPVGCELAQAFNDLGSQVTQVEMASRIMAREDPEVSVAVTDQFTKDGINVLTDHRLVKFGQDHNQAFMEAEHQGQTVRVQFDKVLLAIGRQANVEGFGLEELEIPLTQNGTIEVNEAMQTAYPNIYACGDVVGPFQFTHMASFQAYFSSINAMLSGLWRLKAKYNAVPWAIFTHPEVARVGINEEEAKAKNVNYEVTRYDLDQLDRALADREAHGFIKVLTAPGKDKILGVTIVGYHAGELISEFVFAMTHGMGLKKISAVTHIYPTLLEANKFAANAWRNARLPKKFFPWAEKFFRWLRK